MSHTLNSDVQPQLMAYVEELEDGDLLYVLNNNLRIKKSQILAMTPEECRTYMDHVQSNDAMLVTYRDSPASIQSALKLECDALEIKYRAMVAKHRERCHRLRYVVCVAATVVGFFVTTAQKYLYGEC